MIRILKEKESYKYLEILEVVTIKQIGMKAKVSSEYIRTRNLRKTKPCSRNVMKGMNFRAVSLEKQTRKLIQMYKVFHPRYKFNKNIRQSLNRLGGYFWEKTPK